MERSYVYKEVLPCAAMIAVECSDVVSSILFKAAFLNNGLSYYIFTLYCNLLGTLVFLSIALLFKRKTELPPMKFPLFSRIFLLGLIGYTATIFGYKGLELGSPTLASAISNLTPAFTFILAVLFRMEKVAFRSSSTKAKIIGTIASISGALVIVFYKGPKIFSSTSSLSLQRPLASSQSNWIIGGLLETVAFILFSLMNIVQSQVMKMYPDEVVVTLFYYLTMVLLSVPVSLLEEPNMSSWRLKSGIAVAAVLYSGLIGYTSSAIVYIWSIRMKGPVFVAIFKPTSIVLAAVMSVIFLGEAVYLGSVVGSVIISAAVYTVLWGKAKEEKEKTDDESGISTLGSLSDGTVPLLRS